MSERFSMKRKMGEAEPFVALSDAVYLFNSRRLNMRSKPGDMISVESWPQPAIRAWTLMQRFQKFLVVGGIGFATNQGALYALHSYAALAVPVASPIAILLSMIVTFYLNEIWTWQDRGSGRILGRARTYVPINLGGLAINWGILTFLHESVDMHYLIANLIGAAVAAIWNFSLNNAITWRS